MATRQAEALLLHVERRRILQLVLPLLNVTDDAALLYIGERALHGLDVVLLQLGRDDGVVGPVDEGVFRRLVTDDAHLRVGIVLHLVVVAVQMVGRDVQQDGDVGTEVIHIVQLERRELDDIVFMRIFSHLQGQRVADVTCQSGIVARLTEDMVDKAGGGGLAVRAGDADHVRLRVATGKLYLADDRYLLLNGLLHNGSRFGYAGTLDDLVGIQDLLLRMLAFLPLDVTVVQHLLVLVSYLRHV